jgi:hypothetical protein
MKSHLSATLLTISAQSPQSERKLGLEGAVSILVLLSFCLTLLGPSTLFAKEHRQSEWQRSLMLPPAKEAPPPPPPTENLVEYGDNSPGSSATVTLCNATAEPRCSNILELPRSVYFPRHRLLPLYRKHQAVRSSEEDTAHCEISDNDADREDSQADQPPH